MGQTQTKPIQHQLLLSLQQAYEPFSRSEQFPGSPIHLKLISNSLKYSPYAELMQKYKKIDHYSIMLKLDQQALKKQQYIYEYRKTNLPCMVQMVYYQLQKQQCDCFNNGYKLTAYTEHVDTRLANFRVKNYNKPNKYIDLEHYESFSLDQGIYLLINTLHAYQLLSEQYQINYPSSFTIGINVKAQVKVWMNENWALNTQNHRKISHGAIIEEVINLIQERTLGTFSQILNLKYNYLSFTFDSIQQKLSKYTINFHKGKKTLQQRIAKHINSKQVKVKQQQKISMNGYRTKLQIEPQTATIIPPSPLTKPSHHMQKEVVQKRYNSQDFNRVAPQQMTQISFSCQKPQPPFQQMILTGNRTVNNSPQKRINFTYQKTDNSSSRGNSPKLSTPTKQSWNYPLQSLTTSQNSLYQNTYFPMSNIATKQPTYFGVMQKTNSFEMKRQVKLLNSPPVSHFTYKLSTQSQKMIEKKLDLAPIIKVEDKRTNRFKSNGVSPIINIADQMVFKPTKSQQNTISIMNQNPPLTLVHSQTFQIAQTNTIPEKKVSFAGCNQQPIFSLRTDKHSISLSDITQQFKNLLQSDKKIDHVESFEQQEATYYNDDHQDHEEDYMPISVSRTQINPFVRSFQEIKQVDEEISYSVQDQN